MLYLGLVCLLLAGLAAFLAGKLVLLYRGLAELSQGVSFCLDQEVAAQPGKLPV